MDYSEPARTRIDPTRSILVVALLVVIAAVAAGVAYQSRAASSPRVASSPSADLPANVAAGTDVPRDERRGPLGPADGLVPDGTTVFDDAIPGVANLDRALLDALRHAAADARDGGVDLYVNSGWRSPRYQERLLRDAISKYGSTANAARYVGTPETSAHVSGDAVDIGPFEATAWLSRHGSAYGLCQIYRNEPWHYELRPEAVDHRCPRMYVDAAHDPRMLP